MLVSIIIPAYNEEEGIGPHLQTIVDFMAGQKKIPNLEAEVLVVNDGSKDQTAAVIQDWHAKYPWIRLLDLGQNQGKGAAVRAGFLAAQGDVHGFSDADGSSPIVELTRVLQVLENKKADIVIGSRAKFSLDAKVEAHFHRRVIGRVFNGILQFLLRTKDAQGNKIKDTQCGFKWMTKAASQAIWSQMKIDGFAFDVEMLYLANRLNLGVEELPINWADRGESRVNLITDPLKMFLQVCSIRFKHR